MTDAITETLADEAERGYHPASVLASVLARPRLLQFVESETIGQVAAALAQAQGEFPPLLKDRNNEFYGSKYATLAQVVETVAPALAKAGIARVASVTRDADGQLVLFSRLVHSSGEWFGAVWPLITGDGKNKQQILGSAKSYAERYCLTALTGVAADDDDDGNAAGSQEREQRAPSADPDATAQFAADIDAAADVDALGALASVIGGNTTISGAERAGLRKQFNARMQTLKADATREADADAAGYDPQGLDGGDK